MIGRLLHMANLKKAYYYCKKNGIVPSFYAVRERLTENNTCYQRVTPDMEELERQKKVLWNAKVKFSILVPAYETKGEHFREMLESVLAQTYEEFELLIADASPSDKVEKELAYYKDKRIRYIRLPENKGISENTNAALQEAGGDYIGLLDHDDVLEPDALFRMMEAIQQYKSEFGKEPQMLYSDEDKGNEDLTEFFDLHEKAKFNLDLILSNNYICHFLVMKSELMKELGFRKEYDGAQDHDLVLRAAAMLMDREREIRYVPGVLYHWRCHSLSTAENPRSKMYAYEAGRRAVEDFCNSRGWQVQVLHTKHLGFFRVVYQGDIFDQREDLGAVGGRILKGNKISGGAYTAEGEALYEGLHKHYSGYMKRAVLQQDVDAVDIRKIRVRKELHPLLEEIKSREEEPVKASLLFGEKVREMGYRIMWDPMMPET